MRRLALLTCSIGLVVASTAGAQVARSWALPQIEVVVGAGLMALAADEFRPEDPLTAGELAVVLTSLGAPEVVVDVPDRAVSIRELDAQLVSFAGLRSEARQIRLAASRAGLSPRPWLGTETVARLLGLRVNHAAENEHLELQVSQPATRAEAAYSIARSLTLGEEEIASIRQDVDGLTFPPPTPEQRGVLTRALSFVGSPYVWAGVSEKPQLLGGRLLPGGFDCSGFVWRVYKLEPFAFAPTLSTVLGGRTSYAMSGEITRSERIARADLEPGDVVFFGSRGPRSKPSEVGHMGIYVGNGWMVHSSGFGTTLQPLTGWYERTFAWARRPLAEAGVGAELRAPGGGGGVSARA